MATVPAAACETPVPDPVAAVVTLTLGHCFSVWVTHRLNSGYKRLEPVSCSETALVGQCCRLWSVAAELDELDEELDELEEEQAPKSRAQAPRVDTITPALSRRDPRTTSALAECVGVDMKDGTPFGWTIVVVGGRRGSGAWAWRGGVGDEAGR
jgi:hypothetical protein